MVLFLAVLALVIVAVPAAGGSLARLSQTRFRYAWLLGVALGIQVLIISVLPSGLHGIQPALHVASYGFAAAFLVLNRRTPGLIVLGLGALLNVAAITANGGVMPASPKAMERAGIRVSAGEFENSAAVDNPRLAFLGDVFALPEPIPLHNVFSIGDGLILLGAGICVHHLAGSTGRRRRPSAPAPNDDEEPAQLV